MTTSTSASVLKDVVAYVDVWSSDKTANYSKPFVQQLQELGAQVSKTFNKQVTHVVFNNGHSATWRKAKKGNVRLVSVLWVGRCYDNRVHEDEELYPALNDDSNPVLKNKKHRCMQPKDSPERTPENDRRMRKKLDKMMKDLAPKQPLVTEVSPIIIDEDNGIVYSPALKRSDYMAQRLKDMKEKRENLSPTASQMVESSSPTGLKTTLGSSPTVFKLIYDQSDDDSSASVAEPGCPPFEDGRTQADQWSSSEKPWLSPCHDLPECISSPLKCPDFKDKTDDEWNRQQKLRRTSVRKRLAEQHQLERPCQKNTSEGSDKHSQLKTSTPSPTISEKGKQKIKTVTSLTGTKPCPDVVTSSCPVSPALECDAAVDLSNKSASPLKKKEQNVPKRARLSVSTLVRSLTKAGNSKRGSSDSNNEDDSLFEDYFSPANPHHSSKRSVLPNLHMDRDIQIPFRLDPAPNKRRQRRSESTGSETNSIKKRKLEERNCGKNLNLHSDESSEPQNQDVKDALSLLDSPNASVTLVPKRQRQSTLPFRRTSTTVTGTQRRRTSSSVLPTSGCTEAETVWEPLKKSVISHNLECKGNEDTVAAGLTEIPSDEEDNDNKQVCFSPKKMVNKTKVGRTLVMTSLSTEKQQTVLQVVKALGGFTVVDQVCESTTHVVSGSHRRTLNILFGIARGCWILSFEWILWCLEQRQWIPEEPYELSEQFPSAQICRLQRHLSAGEHQQDLFQGQPPMFVSQHSQPPTQSLVELIQLCGGTVCKTVRQAGICIGKYNGRRREGSRILSEQWVLDSITHLKQLPYDNYDLD